MSSARDVDVSNDALTQEFEQLFHDHYPLVYRTAYSVTGSREDAEDVVQTIFLRLYRGGELSRLKQNPTAYLYRAAVNAGVSVVRSRRRHVLTDDPVKLDKPVEAKTSSENPAFQNQFLDAIAQLNPSAIEILILRYEHHVVPDFLFSAGEVFLAKAGDFLKWRFRLQWVIGCSAGFALARTVFLVLYSNFGVGIFKAAESDGLFWNTVRAAAAPAIFMASIGLVQSRVLAGRCFRKAQWVLYGLAGAVLATIVFQPVFRQGGRTGNTAGVIIRILQTLIDDVSQPGAAPGWALLRAVLHSLLRNIPLLIWGAAVGTLQSTAIRNEAITRYRWIKACMAGYFLSGVVGGFAIPIDGTTGQLYYSLLRLILISFAAGAVMGLFTSGPLERILFNVQTDSRKQS